MKAFHDAALLYNAEGRGGEHCSASNEIRRSQSLGSSSTFSALECSSLSLRTFGAFAFLRSGVCFSSSPPWSIISSLIQLPWALMAVIQPFCSRLTARGRGKDQFQECICESGRKTHVLLPFSPRPIDSSLLLLLRAL